MLHMIVFGALGYSKTNLVYLCKSDSVIFSLGHQLIIDCPNFNVGASRFFFLILY